MPRRDAEISMAFDHIFGGLRVYGAVAAPSVAFVTKY
jgi:hypothetical protein